MPSLSLVIPAFNERSRLPRALETIRGHVARTNDDWEIIVVDDGSTDATREVVGAVASRWSAIRLIEHGRNRGKGAAVKTGIAASRAPVIGFTDADLAAPIEQIDLLMKDLADADIAIVSRGLSGASLGTRQSLLREAMGRAYALTAAALLIRGLPDAQCGLKLFRAHAAREIFQDVVEDGITFDTEALLVATKRGFRISQRPAIWSHDPDSRIRFSFPMALDVAASIVRLKLRHRVRFPVRAVGPVRPPALTFHPVHDETPT